MAAYSYWAYFGIFYLILLTYQDYKNNRLVDDRRNWFMLGISISLVSHVPSTVWYKLLVTVVLIALYALMRKLKAIGEADINTVSWIFLGFALVNPYNLLTFTAIYIVLTLVYLFLKNYVFRIKAPVQYYGVILLSFIFSCLILGYF